jgi:DNA polymerase-3 subunit alpha
VTPLKEALQLPEMKETLKKYKDVPRVQEMIDYSLVLEGFARSASKHAAGVVIAPGDISEYVPLYKSPNEDDVVTQYTMKDIEDAGLLKMDFLGLRTLSIIDTTLALIERNHGVKINIDEIPLDDKKTYELFGRGDTLGVFQFDSPPMQNYMRALKPTNIEDLSSMNALYRPGPMEHIPDFIDRKHGRKQVEYLHPKLEPILKETYGVIVVQEQVMRIARDLAGFSLAKADEMRRAMGKKDNAKMEAMKTVFIAGCLGNGIPEKTAREIFERLAKFASYGFNKSHSLAYSLIAYQTAYLKAHYTAEFLAASMTHEMQHTDYVVQLIDEAKKFNITTLPPDVNESDLSFTAAGGAIRFGLAGIKQVGSKAVESITSERAKNGQFTSLYNFTSRVDTRLVNKKALEALVQAGAFDSIRVTGSIAEHRSNLFASIEKALSYASASGKNADQDNLFALAADTVTIAEPPLVNAEQNWTERELLSREKAMLGFYVSGHPLDRHRVDVLSFSSHRLNEINDLRNNDAVFLIGVIVSITKRIDKNGSAFAIVTIEDFTGKAECIFWSSAYQKLQHLVVDEQPIALQGRIRKRSVEGAPTIDVEAAFTLTDVRKMQSKGVALKIEANGSDTKTIMALQNVTSKHRGNCTFYVIVEQPDSHAQRRYKLGESFAVAPTDEFLADCDAAFGRNSVLFTR